MICLVSVRSTTWMAFSLLYRFRDTTKESEQRILLESKIKIPSFMICKVVVMEVVSDGGKDRRICSSPSERGAESWTEFESEVLIGKIAISSNGWLV